MLPAPRKYALIFDDTPEKGAPYAHVIGSLMEAGYEGIYFETAGQLIEHMRQMDAGDRSVAVVVASTQQPKILHSGCHNILRETARGKSMPCVMYLQIGELGDSQQAQAEKLNPHAGFYKFQAGEKGFSEPDFVKVISQTDYKIRKARYRKPGERWPIDPDAPDLPGSSISTGDERLARERVAASHHSSPRAH